jgi:hypothetical protein
MKERYDIDFLVNQLKKVYPWIDNIETDTVNIVYASSVGDDGKPLRGTEDIIKLYFNYDNPEYIKRKGNSFSGKEFKKIFFDFFARYFDADVRKYGVPLQLKFYHVGPKEF